MHLKRLEVQGFKSLADKLELQFNPGVTAVVGPNGSGKSNIADAVRWVLGEQSAKSLRGAKMEDVIFSGSDRRKSVGMAEVSITLDNSNAAFPLDYSEITVTRRVYRSGESEYYLNKSACRLRDIHELFMDTGIGREGYSIIGQGKIDEILSTRSEDRRTIIEEAAGIIKYKSRKQQAVKKLNDTEQNLIRVSDIIRELETQVGPLEEQSRRAGEYLAYKDELTDLEVNLVVSQVEEQKQKLAEIMSRDEGLKCRIIEAETRQRNLESEVEEHKLQTGKLDEKINQLQTEIYNTGLRVEKKEAEINAARLRIIDMESQRSALQNEVRELREKEAQERSRHEADRQSMAKLHETITTEKDRLTKAERELSGIESLLQRDQELIEANKADIIDLLNELAGVKNALHSTENEIMNAGRRMQQMDEQGQLLSKELQDTENREKDLEQKAGIIAAEIRTKGEDREELVRKRDVIAGELLEIRQDLDNKRSVYQDSVSRLRALRDLQKDYEGYYRGVKVVLAETGDNARLDGICGVVAELVKVPKEYETAIEVAMGSALQFIVTDTDEAARNAIEFLKTNKAGRATFLPLNTVRPAGESVLTGLDGKEGVLGLADTLVKYDQKYTSIVKYLLGRTVIVDNIRTATGLARSVNFSLKTVTLDGDVVNPGGAMTGGFYKKSGPNLLGRLREIEEKELQKNSLEQEINCLEEAESTVRGKHADCSEQITAIEDRLQELHMVKNSLQKDFEVIRQEKERIRNALQIAVVEKEGLAKDIRNAQERRDKLIISRQELQVQDEAARKGIGEKQSQVAAQETLKSELSKEVTEIRVRLAALQQEEINYTTIIDRFNEVISEIDRQVQRKIGQNNTLDLQEVSLKSDIECLLKEINELTLIRANTEETVNSLRNERQSNSALIMEKESLIKNLAREVAGIRETVYSADIKRARFEIEIENSLAKLAEEYQMTYEEALLKKTEISSRREMTARARELKDAIQALGNVNLGAIEEYKRVSERYDFLGRQYSDLEQAKESLFRVIAEMDDIMTRKFGDAFSIINRNFGQVFVRLFGGGKAELILTDSDNILESGIDIVAQPPGKKPQHLSLLSGGERALTAICLLFAILKAKPSPFCVLDEIEASLDEANVDRFADYLREFADITQFVVITHRKGTMEAADVLYGMTMDDSGVSKMVSMKLSDGMDKVS